MEDYKLIMEPNHCKTSQLNFIEQFQQMRQVASKRILVVDDEEFCISTMTILLGMSGVSLETQVDLCISGMEAYDHVVKAMEAGLGYKLIFMDFNMPGIDGIESTRMIRR